MPVINEYRQQTAASGPGVNANARAPDIGNAVAGLGDAIGRAAMTAADIYAKEKDEQDRIWADNALREKQLAMREMMNGMQGQAAPGAYGFTDQWADAYGKFEGDALQNAPSDGARKYLQEGMRRYGQQLSFESLDFEQKARQAHKGEVRLKSLDDTKKLAFADPKYATTAMAEFKAMVEADPDLDPVAAGETIVRGVQEIAYSAESSLAQKNPAQFLKDAKGRDGRTSWNALTHENQQRLLQAAEQEVEKLQAEKRERIALDIEDHQAMALAGFDVPNQYSKAAVYEAYGPERGEKVWERYSATMQAGKFIGSMAGKSQAQIDEEVAKAAPKPGDGFAARQQAYGYMLQARDRLLQLRNADPAAYVARQTPAVQQSFERFMANPADTAARDDYLAKTMAEQKRLGIQSPQILPQAVADQYVSRFQTSNPEQQAQLLTALSGSYGKHWPKVFGQMAKDLPPTALVIGTVAPKAQVHAARAMSVPKDELFKGVASGDKSDLQASLGTAMTDLRLSLSSSVGGEQTFATVYDSAERMAALYLQQGMSPAQAAQKAAAHVTSEIYSFNSRDGSVYRVPVQYDADAVDEGADNALDNLGDYDIQPPAGLDKKSYISVLKDGGYFVTNDDESGVYLYDSTGSVVRLSGGRPLMFNFDELARVGNGEPSGFGKRADGTNKGGGYFGVLKRPDGNVSTELSIGVEIDGREVEIPALVPGLTKAEIDSLLSGGPVTPAIEKKAVEHAKKRKAAGLSPFAQENERKYALPK